MAATTTALITHESSIGGMADRVVRIADGRIASVERPAKRLRARDLRW